MTEELGKISEIADRILLDDISDIFYRSIVFPFIMRTELDSCSPTIAVFDQRLQKKLGRHLFWADALINFDPQVKRLCNIASLFHNKQYSEANLIKDRQQDFWYDRAIKNVFGESTSSSDILEKVKIEESGTSPQAVSGAYQLRQIAWSYLETNAPVPCIDIMKRVQDLTIEYRDAARGLASSDNVTLNDDQLESLALLHALPMLILLKLYGYSLNKLKLEYDQKYDQEYEPTAESILDFLKFDEFVRPHIMESMGIDLHLSPTLLNLTDPHSIEEEYFLKGRNHVIKQLLVGNHVLTPSQINQLEKQMGIEHEVSDDFGNNSYKLILTKLLKRR